MKNIKAFKKQAIDEVALYVVQEIIDAVNNGVAVLEPLNAKRCHEVLNKKATKTFKLPWIMKEEIANGAFEKASNMLLRFFTGIQVKGLEMDARHDENLQALP